MPNVRWPTLLGFAVLGGCLFALSILARPAPVRLKIGGSASLPQPEVPPDEPPPPPPPPPKAISPTPVTEIPELLHTCGRPLGSYGGPTRPDGAPPCTDMYIDHTGEALVILSTKAYGAYRGYTYTARSSRTNTPVHCEFRTRDRYTDIVMGCGKDFQEGDKVTLEVSSGAQAVATYHDVHVCRCAGYQAPGPRFQLVGAVYTSAMNFNHPQFPVKWWWHHHRRLGMQHLFLYFNSKWILNATYMEIIARRLHELGNITLIPFWFGQQGYLETQTMENNHALFCLRGVSEWFFSADSDEYVSIGPPHSPFTSLATLLKAEEPSNVAAINFPAWTHYSANESEKGSLMCSLRRCWGYTGYGSGNKLLIRPMLARSHSIHMLTDGEPVKFVNYLTLEHFAHFCGTCSSAWQSCEPYNCFNPDPTNFVPTYLPELLGTSGYSWTLKEYY